MTTTATFASLAPALDAVRLSLHVLAGAIWVGGQFTLAGLVPTARKLGEDVARQLARAFARLSWPAYAVLVATGFWNIAATSKGQPAIWQTLVGIKIAVVALAGGGAWLHGRATSRAAIAAWGAVAGIFSVGALVMGVFLAG